MTAPLTGTIEEIGNNNSAQVLRLRKMIVLMGPETATEVTSIVDSTGAQLSIPGDYKAIGYIDKDAGAALTPSLSVSDSTAYGETQPIGEYITATGFTAGFTMKETQKPVLEAYYGMDLSAIQARAVTKEITWDVPDSPDVRYSRLLLVGQHRDGANAIWLAFWLPKASISDIGAQTMSDADDFVYPVTYKSLVDNTVGTSRRPFIAGPGLAGLGATPMGFTLAA